MEKRINAGEFSDWLKEFTRTMKGSGEGKVPCGDCVACCTSSKFIHIRPTDTAAVKNIPKEIMFQAPGLPIGHYLLGYDKKGHCPMFKEGKCSIYEFRAETCRQYDCRALAASGIPIKDENIEIAKKVMSWEFKFTSSESVELYEAVKLAGLFILEYSSYFPKGFVPSLSSQVAILALRVHKEFIGHTTNSVKNEYEDIINNLVSQYSS